MRLSHALFIALLGPINEDMTTTSRGVKSECTSTLGVSTRPFDAHLICKRSLGKTEPEHGQGKLEVELIWIP